jgi:myo-inositol-1(or 4)-monophosphatase
MPAELQKRIEAARGVLLEHVAYFAKHIGKVESHWKYDQSRVTEADLALSRSITGALAQLFREDDLVSEEDLPAEGESPRRLAARFCWVLDPIDGTNNYAAGLNTCGILLGLLEDGLPVYGWTYDHLSRRLIEGGPGRGLLIDGAKIATPPQPTEFGRHDFATFHFPLTEEQTAILKPLLTRITGRALGSSAAHLAYNALGVFSGSVMFKGKIWDVAAGNALLVASGRQMVFLKKDPFPFRELPSHPDDLPNLAGTAAFLRFTLPLFETENRV